MHLDSVLNNICIPFWTQLCHHLHQIYSCHVLGHKNVWPIVLRIWLLAIIQSFVFLFWVSFPFDFEDFVLLRYPWLNFEILWKTVFYYLVKESFDEVPLIISNCIWNSIFLFMFSALRFSALFGSMLLLNFFDWSRTWIRWVFEW